MSRDIDPSGAPQAGAIHLIATLDTKGEEAAFVADCLRACGQEVTIVDAGCLGSPKTQADISREQVMQAGGRSLAELVAEGDRGAAVETAARGVTALMKEAWAAGRLAGVLSLGGSAGATIGTAAMRALPVGTPKVMVSTLASGDCRPYVGDKDICMINSVVDIAGLNRLSRLVLHNAAMAMCGMAQRSPQAGDTDKPLVAATMFGVTTPCVQRARERLEQAGYEVLVFHATGSGGRAMESLIHDGILAGVLDITTTELADEVVGGTLTAGPERLTAAARTGTPQVVSVGATDMVNFGPRESVPAHFADRQFYQHNSTVTLMRTTPAECEVIGRQIGEKLASALHAAVLLPEQGVSAIDAEGQPFDDPTARERLFQAVETAANNTSVHRLPHHINDPAFADAAAKQLIQLMAGRRKS